jgi:DNA-binding transcriptional LysR family regulator
MLRTNLSEILVFMAVVDEGSFVAGGKTLGLTRSAAGKAIQRLEDRLGVRLLHRTTRALSLTDEGRVFHDRGRQILAAVDDAEASVAADRGTPRGVLRLTVPDAFGRLVILPLVKTYLATWPDIQVEVSLTDRQADIVEEGFDLAVRIGAPPADSKLVSRVVTTFTAMLCAAPSYVAARGAPRSIDDLARHDCLVFTSRGRRQPWRFRDNDGAWLKAQGRSRLRLDSGEALRSAAIAGLGIAYLPDFLVADDLAAGRLQQVLPRVSADDATIVAIYPTRRLLEPRVRRFIDLMVDALARPPVRQRSQAPARRR